MSCDFDQWRRATALCAQPDYRLRDEPVQDCIERRTRGACFAEAQRQASFVAKAVRRNPLLYALVAAGMAAATVYIMSH